MAASPPAVPAISALPDDLRLQARSSIEVRFARANGWQCCEGWHYSPEDAARCLNERLGNALPPPAERHVVVVAMCRWPGCKAAIGERRRHYCEPHAVARARNPYALKTAAGRREHRRAVERWAAANPELNRVLKQRGSLVWRLVHRHGLERTEARQLANKRYPLPRRAA